MANEYCTLAQVKQRIDGLAGLGTARDALLEELRENASRAIDEHCGRRFYLDGSATARTYRPDGATISTDEGLQLLVHDIGTTAGLVVEYGSAADGWTAITADVENLPDNAIVRGRPITSLLWSGSTVTIPTITTRQRFRVTAAWGWPAIPAVVEEAAILQTLRLLKRKDSIEGVAGSSEWGAVRMSRVDPDVAAMLANFVEHGVA